MEKIKIGKIVSAVGLKGEVKVYNYSENPDRYETLEEIFILEKNKYQSFVIENVRYKEHMVILKLKGVDNRNQSEDMKNFDVFMDEKDLEELPEGVYYIKDMIGMKVLDQDGVILGYLKDVLTNTPQKIYVVKREDNSNSSQNDKTKNKDDILIPGVDEFIREINMEEKVIRVKVIEGLYEN